ncbi:MAG: short chain dehydrogenase, partial [Nocardioidaceae bacterium]
MSDRYQSLIRTPVGQLLAKRLGLPDPVPLRRWREGDPLVPGTVGLGGDGRLAPAVAGTLDGLGVTTDPAPAAERRYLGLVFDASGLTTSASLSALQAFFGPLLRSLEPCSRVVVLGTPPEVATTPAERVAQRALEGFTRSLGKEVGRGGTVQLVYVAPGAEAGLASTLAFLLSGKSAYVSGQVVRLGVHGQPSMSGAA